MYLCAFKIPQGEEMLKEVVLGFICRKCFYSTYK